MRISDAGVFWRHKGPRYFGERERERTGGMGRSDASQRSHTHKKAPAPKRVKTLFDKNTPACVQTQQLSGFFFFFKMFLPALWKILSAASAPERSLTERQKHRNQDAPRPLPHFLKGQRPRCSRAAPSSSPSSYLHACMFLHEPAAEGLDGNPNSSIYLRL